MLGALLTLVLPEPAGRSLDEISGADDVVTAAELVLADTDPSTVIPEVDAAEDVRAGKVPEP